MNIEVINLLDDKIELLDELKSFLYKVCEDEKLDNVIFNVIIVNNEKIHEINKEYRGIDRLLMLSVLLLKMISLLIEMI